jgi:tRNA nucleotidyltransferase (CCA-adding enzyme)
MKQITIPSEVLEILSTLEKNNFPAYVVGGSLRDALLGKQPHDWDVTTPALPDQMLQIFTSAGYTTIPTGVAHGTVTVLIDHTPIECTTYRIDGDYTDARHPDKVQFTDRIADDLARRDFTVNAMACRLPCIAKRDETNPTPAGGLTVSIDELEIVDLYGGQEDLAAGIIRCVGDPVARLTEDALRILRGVRFCVQLGFTPDAATEEALCHCREGLSRISAERITSELTRTLSCGNSCADGLRLMSRTGLWKYVLPEVENSNISKYFETQKELFEAVDFLPCNAAMRLALLLCGTDVNGAMAACRRLKLSNKMTDAVVAYVDAIDRPCPVTDAQTRRYMADLGGYAEGALIVAAACHLEQKADYEAARDRCDMICARGDCLTIADLAIDGKTLMHELGLRGRKVGEMLAKLLDVVLEDADKNEKEILLRIAKMM